MMTDSPTQFGRWLDATMRSRGMSQADVARHVGVADVQVSRWRRGHVIPSVRYLHRIAETFGVPRVRLEHMAGYPGADEESAPDPELEAELEACQARYREIVERKVPPELWGAYLEACDALAERMARAFDDTYKEARRSAGRHIGFRTKEQP